MRKRREPCRAATTAAAAAVVPPGTPAWITTALIEQTLRVWQPHYAKSLTTEDAVMMVKEVDRLLHVLTGVRTPARK